MAHLCAERFTQAAVLWVLVVIEDHVLVHLFEAHRLTLRRKSRWRAVRRPPADRLPPGCCRPRTTRAQWRPGRIGGAAVARSDDRPAPPLRRRRVPGRRRERAHHRRRTTPASRGSPSTWVRVFG